MNAQKVKPNRETTPPRFSKQTSADTDTHTDTHRHTHTHTALHLLLFLFLLVIGAALLCRAAAAQPRRNRHKHKIVRLKLLLKQPHLAYGTRKRGACVCVCVCVCVSPPFSLPFACLTFVAAESNNSTAASREFHRLCNAAMTTEEHTAREVVHTHVCLLTLCFFNRFIRSGVCSTQPHAAHTHTHTHTAHRVVLVRNLDHLEVGFAQALVPIQLAPKPAMQNGGGRDTKTKTKTRRQPNAHETQSLACAVD